MKNYIIKYLRYLSRPLPCFLLGVLLTIIPMVVCAEVLDIDYLGPEFSYGIFSGIGLKIMMDSVKKIS